MSMLFNHWFEDEDPLYSISKRCEDLRNELDDSEKKCEDYSRLCCYYVEEIYNFISNFRRDNLDPKQQQSLDLLFEVANKYLNDSKFKDVLYHKYITKDYYFKKDDPRYEAFQKKREDEMLNNSLDEINDRCIDNDDDDWTEKIIG